MVHALAEGAGPELSLGIKPVSFNDIAGHGFDLLATALLIKRQQTADRVGGNHNPVSAIDRAEHRGKHADIGFAAGDENVSIARPRKTA
jgi:hypothetical protein